MFLLALLTSFTPLEPKSKTLFLYWGYFSKITMKMISYQVGCDADFVMLEPSSLQLVSTWVAGVKVFPQWQKYKYKLFWTRNGRLPLTEIVFTHSQQTHSFERHFRCLDVGISCWYHFVFMTLFWELKTSYMRLWGSHHYQCWFDHISYDFHQIVFSLCRLWWHEWKSSLTVCDDNIIPYLDSMS